MFSNGYPVDYDGDDDAVAAVAAQGDDIDDYVDDESYLYACYNDGSGVADNEDVGDFTDVMNGRDITLTTVGPEVTGTNYNKTTIMPKVKETQLADSKSAIEALLDNQPNPMEVFKKYSYEEMKQSLQEWLTPEDEYEEGAIIDDEKEEEVVEKPSKAYSIKTPVKEQTSKADKFDALFEDEE